MIWSAQPVWPVPQTLFLLMIINMNIFLLALIIVLVCLFFAQRRNKYKIVVCMSYTDNISSYSKKTEMINRKYAQKHGYDFSKFDFHVDDRALQWSKIKAVNYLLQSPKKFDYIFWIDSDAFFNDFDKALDSVIDQNNQKDIILCDDAPNSGRENTINTGTMLIKSTAWCKTFCHQWYEYAGKFLYEPHHEQSVLESFIAQNVYGCKDRIAIAPTKSFNSAAYELKKYMKCDDYIIHLMAEPENFRIAYIDRWLHDNRYKMN